MLPALRVFRFVSFYFILFRFPLCVCVASLLTLNFEIIFCVCTPKMRPSRIHTYVQKKKYPHTHFKIESYINVIWAARNNCCTRTWRQNFVRLNIFIVFSSGVNSANAQTQFVSEWLKIRNCISWTHD